MSHNVAPTRENLIFFVCYVLKDQGNQSLMFLLVKLPGVEQPQPP